MRKTRVVVEQELVFKLPEGTNLYLTKPLGEFVLVLSAAADSERVAERLLREALMVVLRVATGAQPVEV